MVSFLVHLSFPDGPSATVCGLCRPDSVKGIQTRLKKLEEHPFGVIEEGILIDRRFVRLLREALEPERDGLYLLGGSIRVDSADAPCGAVLGDPFERTRSAQEDLTSIVLPSGKALRLLLRPGQGGAVFSCDNQDDEGELYALLSRTFPSPQALAQLEQRSQLCLYTLDHSPGDPILNGSCFVQLKKNHAEGR